MKRERAPLCRGLGSLEAERRRLLAELGRIGKFRRGSISVNRPRCGKPACACRRDHRASGYVALISIALADSTVIEVIASAALGYVSSTGEVGATSAYRD